ncbi:SH3 domain-containing protein [Malaciobacter canalis]|uniref:SH3 domain-containing C40 family peptidase n=1 Tax=Malaciobacter canalis TaxID=1912871 RepID=UPI00384B1833
MSKILKPTFFLFIIITFFTACSNKNIQIQDLKTYSQNPKDYLKNESFTFKNQNRYNKKFYDKYFEVWNNPTIKISKKTASWGFLYKKKDIYLQNFSKASKQWFDKQIENSNFNEFKSKLQKAITIKNSNIKVLPTKQMMFYNPYNAGEGFPFDYNQNSSIKINTPILVSHFSKDKAWAFIKTSSFYGWIDIRDIAFVDEEFIKKFKTKNYAVAVKDKFNIYKKHFIENIQLGTIFPYEKDKFFVAAKKSNQKAFIKTININKENISLKPLKFNNKNLRKIAQELIKEQYGWGGILGFRDCSSFTQDFFSSFGIYLDRNSKQQIKNGKYYKIKNFTNKKKKEFILKNAKAFKSLIYLKGHIMLYIGNIKDEPLVMHNVWGVKTRVFLNKKGRNIIGKNIISSLEFGKELETYDDTNTVLDKIEGIIVLDER